MSTCALSVVWARSAHEVHQWRVPSREGARTIRLRVNTPGRMALQVDTGCGFESHNALTPAEPLHALARVGEGCVDLPRRNHVAIARARAHLVRWPADILASCGVAAQRSALDSSGLGSALLSAWRACAKRGARCAARRAQEVGGARRTGRRPVHGGFWTWFWTRFWTRFWAWFWTSWQLHHLLFLEVNFSGSAGTLLIFVYSHSVGTLGHILSFWCRACW